MLYMFRLIVRIKVLKKVFIVNSDCLWLVDCKERLVYQAMILYNYVPFQNLNFSLRKKIAPRKSEFEFFLLKAVPYGMETHFYHIR